jgi:hypothetical protein
MGLSRYPALLAEVVLRREATVAPAGWGRERAGRLAWIAAQMRRDVAGISTAEGKRRRYGRRR